MSIINVYTVKNTINVKCENVIFTYPIKELASTTENFVYEELCKYLKEIGRYLSNDLFCSLLYTLKNVFTKNLNVDAALELTMSNRIYNNLSDEEVSDLLFLSIDFVEENKIKMFAHLTLLKFIQDSRKNDSSNEQ